MKINWDVFWDHHLGKVVLIGAVILTAVVVARIVRSLLRKAEKRRIAMGENDTTQFRFLRNSVSAVVFIVAFGLVLYIIPGGESLAVSIFAGAGIFAAIVGFASQQAFSNIVSGVFIVIFKPYRVGDIVEISPLHAGVVEDITLRHTVIRNFNNKRVIIPNSVISNETVTNATINDTKICRFIEFGISYDSDIGLAKKIMQQESEAHPLCIDNRTEDDLKNDLPKVKVRVIGFGESSVNLRANAWAGSQAESFEMHTELNELIKARFDAEGIKIPFPHRTLIWKTDSNDLSKAANGSA